MKKEGINSDKYLITCKENFFNKLWPSDPSIKNMPSYKTLLDIARQYIELGRMNELVGFFMESQYCINLWTAHFILELGKPDDLLKLECINIIQDYSVNELYPTIADLETKWLAENVGKYF